jgi:fructose-1,6-bisphosphatase II / sedoheptulose-1,7-bisphosphatase
MFGRLIFRDDDERERAARIGLGPAEQRQGFALSDLASGHAHLVLAGVTGDVLEGATNAGAQVLSLGAGVCSLQHYRF